MDRLQERHLQADTWLGLCLCKWLLLRERMCTASLGSRVRGDHDRADCLPDSEPDSEPYCLPNTEPHCLPDAQPYRLPDSRTLQLPDAFAHQLPHRSSL